MYALPLRDEAFDLVVLQMVLHYAEDPAKAVAEARRVLAPGGIMAVVDLAPHDRTELRERMAHRVLGFSDTDMGALLRDGGLLPTDAVTIEGGALSVRIWCAEAAATAPARDHEFFEAVL
jgi:ArsR family transcriptional regulator